MLKIELYNSVNFMAYYEFYN